MTRRGISIYAGAVFWTFCCVLIFPVVHGFVFAQSSDIAFPTALTENQVSGVIKARDLGDPRLTTYYFTFNGRQGDLFINVVTKNLSGSVDVFLADGMRPLSNIIVYADVVRSETGRVIYLRKPEKLILRIQGRTPNDDQAEFQIKFAGGFEAAVPASDEPPVPKVTDVGENSSGQRVNSVGTIVAVIPKPKPTPKTAPPEITKVETKNEEAAKAKEVTKPAEEKPANEQPEETKAEEKPTENNETRSAEPENKEPTSKESKPVSTKAKPSRRRSTTSKADRPAAKAQRSETDVDKADGEPGEKPGSAATQLDSKPQVVVTDTTAKGDLPTKKEPPSPTPNPLANVRLVILFKDGTKVERPMTEVLRFTADQKNLTVISTNGRVAKFPILDVLSVTIQ